MPDPFTTALLAKGAGTLVKTLGSRDAARRRGSAVDAELARQAEFQESATQSIGDVLTGFRNPSASYLRNQPITALRLPDDVTPIGSAPASVKTNLAKMLKGTLARGKEDARRQSRLGGASRQIRGGVQDVSDLGLDLDLIRNLAQGSVSTLEGELGTIDQFGGAGTLADILSGVGDIYGIKAARTR